MSEAEIDAAARVRIGVVPHHAFDRRSRLFAALQQVYPVQFEGRAHGYMSGLDGLVAIGPEGAAAAQARPESLPCLIAFGDESFGATLPLVLSDRDELATPLRGSRLTDAHSRPLTSDQIQPGDGVLGMLDGGPAWAIRPGPGSRQHLVGTAPRELDAAEALRNRLVPGRSLALLAVAQFLSDLTIGLRWEPPPLRACFLIDDPNLHWPSYGNLRYADVLRDARVRGYHLSVAMVPLDSWLAHPRAVGLFRSGADHLSIVIHGNDHNGPELGRSRPPTADAALVAQALRRIASFERRTGLSVDRVMVPPHEALSETTAQALLRSGCEAVFATRPYPWAATSHHAHWLERPAGADPVNAWQPSEIVAGGLPLLLRADFRLTREELVLRAFLGQPLVLYGHHDLMKDGLDVLAEATTDVNRLGHVRWCSPGQVVRTGAQTRRTGQCLDVRMLARKMAVEIPDGVTLLRIDASQLQPPAHARLGARIGGRSVLSAPAADVATINLPRPGTVELALDVREQPLAISDPPRRIWPIVRRMVGEGRDRGRGVLKAGSRARRP